MTAEIFPTSAGTKARDNVETKLDVLRELPDGWFKRRDLPDELRGQVMALGRRGLLTVEYPEDTLNQREQVNRYRISDETRELMAELQEDRYAPCPCGHGGISNLGDGEFTCGYEFCDETFDRDEVTA